MKHPLTKFVICSLVFGLVTALSWTAAEAQFPFLPGLSYNTFSNLDPYTNYLLGYSSFHPYGLWGGFNPYFTFSGGISPLLLSQGYYSPVMEILATYNYLQYAVGFYEIARNVPLLYMRDIQADQIGALMYSYADSLGISPQEAIGYFIQQQLLQ